MYSKDLAPEYPDVILDPPPPLQLVYGSYYFAVSQAYNSRTHSRNNQCNELLRKPYSVFHLCQYREQDLRWLEKYSILV